MMTDDVTALLSTEQTEDLSTLERLAADCRACPLWENATQVVFGSGPQNARVMLVGEQPGDKEDLQGEPFVGPAGQLLRQALDEAGFNPDELYLTNAVKHFKWVPRGRMRLHKTPGQREIKACRPWLEEQIRLIQPGVLACLGATAARAVIDKNFKITVDRGRFVDSLLAPRVFATVHPSYLLRLPDPESKDQQYRLFLKDLDLIHRGLAETR